MPGIRLAVLAVGCAALIPQVGPSQDSRYPAPTPPEAPQLPGLSTAQTYQALASQNAYPRLVLGSRFDTLDREIAEAARKLRQAETGSERSEAEEELTELLSKDYDQRLEGYAKEIDRLEKAIDEMRAKLEKRKDAKSDMIDLRIRVLEAEADDLGWPQHHRGAPRFGVALPPGQTTSAPFYTPGPTAAIPGRPEQAPVRTQATPDRSRQGK